MSPGRGVHREKVRHAIRSACISFRPARQIGSGLTTRLRFRYHLLNTNCNHFANDLCVQLTGKGSPQWINRLAGFAAALEILVPRGCLPPMTPPEAEENAPIRNGLSEKELRVHPVVKLASN
mmetsp:Transcript_17315/g.41371  ORF Transcript_17315/g.41371 Transcript_17315/m.41371 type:complete len:122 (-) Transcript_17315:1466-1831(-)